MRKIYLFILWLPLFWVQAAHAQDGNYVFSGSEAVSFSDIDLATPTGVTWGTDRTPPGYFAMVDNAKFTGAADGTAYIDGYVKYYGQTASPTSFTFPVGDNGDLRTLTVTNPGVGAQFATAWTAGDPGNTSTPGSGITSVSPVGQWAWQDLSNTAAGKTITVSMPDMSGFATTQNLRLVGWNGTQWVNLSSGTGPFASGTGDNATLTGTMVSGITAIGIGSTAFALPVNFGTIEAFIKNGQLIVKWGTEWEKNCKEYVIEASTDGTNWKEAGRVSSKAVGGNSDTPLEYEFTASGYAIAGIGLLFGLLLIPAFRNRKASWIIATIICVLTIAACTKKAGEELQASDVNYIRIVQFDVDGTSHQSKSIKVIKE